MVMIFFNSINKGGIMREKGMNKNVLFGIVIAAFSLLQKRLGKKRNLRWNG